MTFLYLASDKMGEGDPELGRKLMKSFLSELAKSDQRVDVIGCANSGILLTTEGSEVIESLKKLEERGVRIATCGTCLDHMKRRDKLLIGEVGTMDMTVQIMTTADKIIRP
ncbi:sulfurtransferase-like selenium metabolism protein YedF [bacterium]|nr:sulfurtransferase-like selenium metabolism protein YedF [bacterium]MBU1638746.1 sulfurtransferase-like selenium metabolism protein YedF [bacterium]MBU1920737.1 sulfurtransferase-like selenium metabolism protein YedF [bacterium]